VGPPRLERHSIGRINQGPRTLQLIRLHLHRIFERKAFCTHGRRGTLSRDCLSETPPNSFSHLESKFFRTPDPSSHCALPPPPRHQSSSHPTSLRTLPRPTLPPAQDKTVKMVSGTTIFERWWRGSSDRWHTSTPTTGHLRPLHCLPTSIKRHHRPSGQEGKMNRWAVLSWWMESSPPSSIGDDTLEEAAR
jgi:hypothetical protein